MLRNTLLLAIATLCITPLFAHDIAASIVDVHCEDELETCCVFMQYLDHTDRGATIQYLYDAEGRKLEVTHTPPAQSPSGQMTTDYCDNVIYKDGALDRILTDEGYITLATNSSPAYHYFLRDHLGSVHVVFYKFCGKELDRMHGLDWYDSQARMYDPVLNRWHTQDAKAENYYSWSPYAYCAGNPVMMVDPNGKEIWIMSGKNGYQYKEGDIYKDGKLFQSNNKFVKSVIDALAEIQKSEVGKSLINGLQQSSNKFFIKKDSKNSFKQNNTPAAIANNEEVKGIIGPQNRTEGSGGDITWNPKIEEGGLDENGNTNRPAYIGLAHELAHASDANKGIIYLDDNNYPSYSPEHKGLLKSEWRAVYKENLIRKERNLPLRQYYNSTPPLGPKLTADGIPVNYP